MSTMNKWILFILITPLCAWGLFLLFNKSPQIPDFSHEKSKTVGKTDTESQVNLSGKTQTESPVNPQIQLNPLSQSEKAPGNEVVSGQKSAPLEKPSGDTKPQQPSDTMTHSTLQNTPTRDLPVETPAAKNTDGNKILTYRFDADKEGESPQGFSAFRTGRGSQVKWVIIKDSSLSNQNWVLTPQYTGKTDAQFQLLLLDEGDYQDLDVAVKFKPESGKTAQAGGIVIRYQDPNNYYVIRADALKNNYSLYRFTRGKPVRIASKTVKITPNEWHTLRIQCKGDQFEGYLDEKLYIKAQDSTFSKGKIGLWTRKNSIVQFDDLTVSLLGAKT
ncbi:MAG TPA: family 16 glycoside hydrolase [Candidatus Limnocylindrales bacterium]|nr:family 16 glycoside hydrolase [Candidatus Limnocylindrales bacterium]